MKSYLSLVPISARVHKRQSRMTRICIVLAVFLVTSIFSMAEMWVRMEQAELIKKHGDYQVVSPETMKSIYSLAALCFVLILISGILMISSCMNNTVAQRTSFFGMMRCIGASRQQIMRFVKMEALNWCKTAIPVGCMLGTAVCWGLCAILHFFVKGEFADIPLFRVSVSGIVCGIAIGIITVFIAAHSPAKQAAKVSPIAAVSGNTGHSQNAMHSLNAGHSRNMAKPASLKNAKRSRNAGGVRYFKVETVLGIHHAAAAKKNLFLMTGSFTLTIILFFFFAACLDIVHRLLPSESNFSPDVAIISPENTNSIDVGLAAQIEELSGVKYAFGTMYAVSLPAQVNGTETAIDLITYEDFMMENTKKSVASGDLVKVYGDSAYVFTIFSKDSSFDVGDRISIGGSELEIACVASEGIGSLSGSPVVVCSEETFARLLGEQGYMMINVILEKRASEETVDLVRAMAGENEFWDRRDEEYTVYSSYWVFRIAAYGFLAIISFITVLNIMNSVSMGVSARIKQYGAMRAVGMEGRQVTKMIMSEAATYALCGMAAGLILGMGIHYLMFVKLIATHFGGTWKVPFGTIGMIVLLVSVSCVVAVYAPAKRISGMAVAETINEL